MLNGRSVIVTGASGNLGSAVCARLLREGARVMALVHGEGEERPLQAALAGALGGEVKQRLEVRATELAAEASVEAAWDAADHRFGPLFGAAHCAGAWAGGPLQDTSLETFERMIAVNLRSVFLCSRACVRRMAPRREGRIVNVAAYTAFTGLGVAGASAYAASKAGVIALTRAIAEEGAPLGIRASCVAPGTLRTPQNAAAMPQADASGWVPLEDVVEAIVSLLSPAAGALSGAVLTLPSR